MFALTMKRTYSEHMWLREATMDGSAHGALRDANGRFLAGHSGNPSGKKPGTRNRATVLREALGDGEDLAAARIVIDKTLSGDMVAARFIVGRLEPRPCGRPIELDLPEGTSARDIVAAYDVTMRAMATGEITPDEALQVSRVLDGRLRALKIAAREETSIRANAKQSPSPLAGEGGDPRSGEGEGARAGYSAKRRQTPHPPIAVAMGPSLSRKGRGEFSPSSPAFRLHFAGDGHLRNAPYFPQSSPGGSP
jgi:hypothetical protein